jgi:hypothetical protein
MKNFVRRWHDVGSLPIKTREIAFLIDELRPSTFPGAAPMKRIAIPSDVEAAAL